MSATRVKRSPEAESTPQLPQATPQSVGYSSPDHSFTLQAVMELQKSMGQMNATMEGMSRSMDGLKSKVDDLVGWKHKIIGGAAALVAVGGVLGFVIGKGLEYVTFKPATTAAAPAAPQPAAPAPQKAPGP